MGAAADIASESAGAVAGTAAIAGVASEIVSEAAGATASAAAAFSTGTIIPEKDKDTTIQVWFLNNNTEPSRAIEFTMYNTKDTPKSTYYSAELVVSARSSAFFTVTPIPDSYEIRIQGLDKNIFAYAVVLDKAEAGLNPVKPIEGKILFINS